MLRSDCCRSCSPGPLPASQHPGPHELFPGNYRGSDSHTAVPGAPRSQALGASAEQGPLPPEWDVSRGPGNSVCTEASRGRTPVPPELDTRATPPWAVSGPGPARAFLTASLIRPWNKLRRQPGPLLHFTSPLLSGDPGAPPGPGLGPHPNAQSSGVPRPQVLPPFRRWSLEHLTPHPFEGLTSPPACDIGLPGDDMFP